MVQSVKPKKPPQSSKPSEHKPCNIARAEPSPARHDVHATYTVSGSLAINDKQRICMQRKLLCAGAHDVTFSPHCRASLRATSGCGPFWTNRTSVERVMWRRRHPA